MRPFTSTIPFSDALKIALDATTPITRTEHAPLAAADGRVVAHEVISPLDVPPFDRAAMDGYAARCTGAQGARGTGARVPGLPAEALAEAGAQSAQVLGAYRCIGAVYTGEVLAREVQAGECVQIATGAPLPAGADAVVMVEETERHGDMVTFSKAPTPGQNIGRRGADIGMGAIVVSRGQVLTPSRIGALAATGHRSVEVFAKPSVAILSTGNEVIAPGLPLPPGHIYDVNRFTLESVVRQHGGTPRTLPPCGDSIEDLTKAIDLASTSDLIVFSGGSSVGDRDLVRDVIAKRGDMLFHGIAVKPGKPTAFAKLSETADITPLFLGMPGNPTSCLSNAYILLVPVLRKLAGLLPWEPRTITVPLARTIKSSSDRHQFYTVRLVDGLAEPAFKGSGDITSMANADGYIEIPAATETIATGTMVQVTLF